MGRWWYEEEEGERGLQTGLGRGLAVKLRSVKVQVMSGSL